MNEKQAYNHNNLRKKKLYIKKDRTMKIKPLMLIVISAILVCMFSQLLAQPEPEELTDRRKLGQTGMQFLTVPVNARAAALAGALTAKEASSIALFYNPATMAMMQDKMHLSFSQNKWIAEIDYNQATFAAQPFGSTFGVIGFSFLAVDYGDIQETIRYDNEKGYLDIGTFSPTAWSFGIGYAKSLTSMFSVGTQVKIVSQDLGASTMMVESGDGGESYQKQDNTLDALAFDFGIVYRTGFRSLIFAMDVRNFSKDFVYEREEFQLPLVFQVGLAMDMMDILPMDSDMHGLLLSVDASHPRSYSEQMKIGLEYTLLNTLSLRGGYRFPTDEPEINFGFGVNTKLGGIGFGFDYSYSDFGLFGDVQRFGAQFFF
jgi:hypothetical protein